jgi:uncharacterized protein YxjI
MLHGFDLTKMKVVLVHQVHEIGEWFGFETRNKYEILDENKIPLGFAAEQQKGFWGFIMRQYLGHWRKFDVHFFSHDRQLALVAHHPFRWILQRIEIRNLQGQVIGVVQQRFSILTKRFDIENSKGLVLMEVASPVWKMWTFNFMHAGTIIAAVKKKWSGIFAEGFTDKDNFLIEYNSPTMTEEEKVIVMASAVFIDLLYFENKR